MKHPILIIVVSALVAMALGVFTRLVLPTLASKPSSPLPEFSFPDLAGRQRSISEWEDKVRVINFWATWCPPCRKEIPDLIELQRQNLEQELQVIGIAVEDPEPVAEFAGLIGINYPILSAGDQGIELSRQLGNTVGAIPFTLVVDRQGQIVHRQPGQMTKERLLRIVEPLLK